MFSLQNSLETAIFLQLLDAIFNLGKCPSGLTASMDG
jgi:hypothetical protein